MTISRDREVEFLVSRRQYTLDVLPAHFSLYVSQIGLKTHWSVFILFQVGSVVAAHLPSYNPINPLTASAAYIRFLHFLLPCTISTFKHIEDKM